MALGWWVYVSPTNAIAYTAAEPLTWGVDGVGVFDFEDAGPVGPNTRLVFSQSAGSAPVVTDIVLGGTSGARRTIVSYTTSSAAEGLIPVRLPFTAGVPNLVQLRFRIAVERWYSETTAQSVAFDGHFRFALSYLDLFGGGTSFFSLKNLVHNSASESVGGSREGRGIEWNSQFGGNGADGGQLYADSSVPPRWNLSFNDPDALSTTWVHFHTHTDFSVPATLYVRAEMVGMVTNPGGNLSSNTSGAFVPMIGDFAQWDIFARVGGDAEIAVGRMFQPWANAKALSPGIVMILDQEHFTQYPDTVTGTRLSDDPVELRYHALQVFDGTSWHELLDWKIVDSDLTPETDHGYTAEIAGYLTHAAGTVSLDVVNAVNKYVLCGLTYSRSDALTTSLSYNGIEDIVVTGATYHGPTWRGPYDGGYPWIQQEDNRGWYICHPSTSVAAVFTYTATVRGSYRFVGDFARATTSAGGDGVAVSVTTDIATLFSETIVPPHTVDVATPFTGTSNRTFDETQVAMLVGDVVRFSVAPLTGASADATAFRLRVEFIESEDRTPEVRGGTFYIPPDCIRQSALGGGFVSGGRGIAKESGLRHQVYYFVDADDAEIWKTLPDGVIALAIGQSESDGFADVAAELNASGQLEWDTTAGNNRVWVHTWSRGTRRPGTSGTDTPQATSGAGFVPRGTTMFTNDLTLAGDNLTNGRRIGFHGLTRKTFGFTGLANSDTYTGQAGIVATAFQSDGVFVKTRIIARDRRSTTIMFVTTSATPFSGYLHVWGNMR